MQKKNFRRRKRYARRDFYLSGIPSGVKIPENTPEALEMGLKYLKRQMKDTNTMGIYKDKTEFKKPSAVRRKIKKDAVRKQKLWNKITEQYWKDFTWLVPPSKNYKPGPNLPDLRDN